MSYPLQEIFLVKHSGKILAGDVSNDVNERLARQSMWWGKYIYLLDELQDQDGSYRVRISGPFPKSPPDVLDVQGGSTEAGALLQWYSWHGGDNQRFLLKPTEDGHYFYLVAKHSGLVLDVPGFSLKEDEHIQQYPRNGGDNQRWRLSGHPAPITVRHSGLVLDVRGGSKEPGALVQQYEFHGGLNQLFTIEPVAFPPFVVEPVVRIVCAHSGLVLEVQGGSKEPGAKLQQNHRSSGDNQLFYLLQTVEGRYFGLHPKHNAPKVLALDVESASETPGALVIQWWTDSNIILPPPGGSGIEMGNPSFNQQWRL